MIDVGTIVPLGELRSALRNGALACVRVPTTERAAQ
ncbi:hypothetical protein BC739_004581 [Kutzneria viridogrisea]|uniref:Uncharacterized protein n=1 Tax=Kutzneria viridogrisea TaxID=47990 RepID=A0ABR6BKY9_9PSEU|nr:hypothetical protein [Kutzneria viridogrisea]